MFRGSCHLLTLLVSLVGMVGCAPSGVEVVSETDEKQYQLGQDYKNQGRLEEALGAFELMEDGVDGIPMDACACSRWAHPEGRLRLRASLRSEEAVRRAEAPTADRRPRGRVAPPSPRAPPPPPTRRRRGRTRAGRSPAASTSSPSPAATSRRVAYGSTNTTRTLSRLRRRSRCSRGPSARSRSPAAPTRRRRSPSASPPWRGASRPAAPRPSPARRATRRTCFCRTPPAPTGRPASGPRRSTPSRRRSCPSRRASPRG